jgi:hypothetical protein
MDMQHNGMNGMRLTRTMKDTKVSMPEMKMSIEHGKCVSSQIDSGIAMT